MSALVMRSGRTIGLFAVCALVFLVAVALRATAGSGLPFVPPIELVPHTSTGVSETLTPRPTDPATLPPVVVPAPDGCGAPTTAGTASTSSPTRR